MAFNTALSGVNAASKNLDVIGNNIANVSSNGFKRSRAEFGDLFASDPFGNSKTAAGQGALTDIVRQNFAAGSLNFTERSLDFAVKGAGFMVTQPDPNAQQFNYTRDGAFGVDNKGFVINSTNERLMALPVTEDGAVTSTSLASAVPVQVPATGGAPQETGEVDITANLPSDAEAPLDATGTALVPFDPDDPDTYNSSTSTTVYDSLGSAHTVTTYFRQDDPATGAAPNTWEMYVRVDGERPEDGAGGAGAGAGPHTIIFNDDGTINTVTPASGPNAGTAGPPSTTPIPILEEAADLGTGAQDLDFNINVGQETTQFNAGFSVSELTQDGNTVGRLSGLSTNEEGLIQAEFTNGDSRPLGKIMLADFRNNQGLKPIGSNAWQETLDSGEPIIGEAGTGRFGNVASGALETSNVNLTNELVSLITAQRDFDANARTIDVENQVSDTIINIR